MMLPLIVGFIGGGSLCGAFGYILGNFLGRREGIGAGMAQSKSLKDKMHLLAGHKHQRWVKCDRFCPAWVTDGQYLVREEGGFHYEHRH